MTTRVATFDELATSTLYGLLRLRIEVFVVEQNCPYPDLDGRDTEPGTRHLWIDDDVTGEPIGYLRVLDEPTGDARIGRVCVAVPARGTGVAGQLMRTALNVITALDVTAGPDATPGPDVLTDRDVITGRRCVLSAQSHLTGFYARFGFSPAGPEFIEDGIPHIPMSRPAGAPD